jgi:hypothetical protein
LFWYPSEQVFKQTDPPGAIGIQNSALTCSAPGAPPNYSHSDFDCGSLKSLQGDKMRMNTMALLSALAAFSISASAHDHRPTRYIAFEIPAPELQDPLCLPGYATQHFGAAINDRRFVAGAVGCYHDFGEQPNGGRSIQVQQQPSAWSPQTGPYLLPTTPDHPTGLALGVDVYNNAYGYLGGTSLDGMRWSPGGGVSVVIGADPDPSCSVAVSMAITANARGEIAGWGFRPAPEDPVPCNLRLVVRRPGGTEALGPVGSTPNAINSAGVAAGGLNSHAIKWNSRTGELVNLRPQDETVLSSAADINDRDVAVGVDAGEPVPFGTTTGCPPQVALTWDRHNRERALPHLAGMRWSSARAINNDGVIVGSSSPQECSFGAIGERVRAVVWKNGRAFDLNQLMIGRPGVVLMEAGAINERGEILAYGYRSFEPAKPCPQLILLPDGSTQSDDSVCHDGRAYLLVPLD